MVCGIWKLTGATAYYSWDRFNKNRNYPTSLRGNVAKANKELSEFGVWDLYCKEA